MDPFSCIIDNRIRRSFDSRQFREAEFLLGKVGYNLKYECNSIYCNVFYTCLINKKQKYSNMCPILLQVFYAI